MATFELVSCVETEGFPVFSVETLDELEEALQDLAETLVNQSSVTLNFFWPQTKPTFTVPEAFQVAVEVLNDRLPSVVKNRCEVASLKVATYRERFLSGRRQAPREVQIGEICVRIVQGDITRIRVDAIVNASSIQLLLGSGVSGAIGRAASNPRGLQAAMSAKVPIPPGGVVVTEAFGLPLVKRILHAATASGDAEVIKKAARNILTTSAAFQFRSVAIPAIGAGTGGLSTDECARIILEAIATLRVEIQSPFPRQFIMVLNDPATFFVFSESFRVGASGS